MAKRLKWLLTWKKPNLWVSPLNPTSTLAAWVITEDVCPLVRRTGFYNDAENEFTDCEGNIYSQSEFYLIKPGFLIFYLDSYDDHKSKQVATALQQSISALFNACPDIPITNTDRHCKKEHNQKSHAVFGVILKGTRWFVLPTRINKQKDSIDDQIFPSSDVGSQEVLFRLKKWTVIV